MFYNQGQQGGATDTLVSSCLPRFISYYLSDLFVICVTVFAAHATKEVKALLESINAARGTPPSADTLVVRLIFVALIEARHVEENVSDIVHK